LNFSNQSSLSDVHLALPKFEIDFNWENLVETLKSLDVKTLFEEENAKLTEISFDRLHVTKVAHKAIINVNEEGSVAAAPSESLFVLER